MIATGLFADLDKLENLTGDRRGVLAGGGFELIGPQLLLIVAVIVWTSVMTAILLLVCGDIP